MTDRNIPDRRLVRTAPKSTPMSKLSLSSVVVPAVLLGACAGAPLRQPGEVEVAAEIEATIGGCAIGDVDPNRAGDEIVAVSSDGAVHLVSWNGNGWQHQVVHQCRGEQIQVAIGDADPNRPGLEVVTVGMAEGPEDPSGAGAVWVHGLESDGWWVEQALGADRLVHGVAVHDGGIVAAGFGASAWRLVRGEKGWNVEDISDLPGDGKAVVDLGDSVAIGCTDGSLVRVRRRQGLWRLNLMDKQDSGRSRLDTDGTAILTANDDGTLVLVLEDGAREVYRESLKLRGAVIGELDGDPDLELATTGYDSKVVLLNPDAQLGGWQPRVLYSGAEPFHHLAAGDVYGTGRSVLVACGFSGELIVLRP